MFMEKQIYLSDFFGSFIEDMKTGRRLKFRQSCMVSEGYILNMRSALVRLQEFEKVRKRRYLLDEVDMAFQRDLIGFLVSKRMKPNTIKTRLSCIHTVMREAFIRGLTKNDAYNDPDFIPLSEAVDSVYLTEEQIDALWEMSVDKMRGNKMLEKTRDLFVMGCLTGQRFSDYSRIERSMIVNIAGFEFIKLRQKKTDITVLIPVCERMKAVIDKYNGKMPEMTMLQFNTCLKVLGRLMGWTWRPDTVEGNERFCDMMSSHTARRSFATNAYQRGVPLKSIMAVTGHQSERTLRIYLRLGTKEKALMAARDFGSFLEIGARR